MKEALKSLWVDHRKPLLIAIAALAVVAIAVVVWYVTRDDAEEPQQVSSAWPVAQRERVIEQPEEPVRWPLTGAEAAPDEDPVGTRVIAVKIENSPMARPQSGLDHADIVYEMETEGGITRFNALFHSRVPETLGPVRSARMPDLQVVSQYSALFANSGANSGVLRAIRSAGLDLVDHDAASAAYRRVSFRSAPHNLYLDLARAREIGVSRGYPTEQEQLGPGFSASVAPGVAAATVTIPFSPANTSRWEWRESDAVYVRSNNGQPHMDRESEEQYSAKNVVVLWAGTSATGPSRTLEIDLSSEGDASVFRDGVRIDGTWEASATSPAVIRDVEGSIIRLAPGNTWYQVVRPSVQIRVE